MGKLAIKRLTQSDLTLFEWQFRNRAGGNQKSINLNADVFINELYPSLPETDAGRTGRLGVDLFIYGPGKSKVLNLQRKIIKGNSYKNWRLNGEFISNPSDEPERFNVLVPGDYVIFDFEGDLFPTGARAIFAAKNEPADASIHQGLDHIGIESMRAIDMAGLSLIVHSSGTLESHPINELLLDSAIEDAAQSGLDGTKKLQQIKTGRKVTKAELRRARQRVDEVGREGEELLDAYFKMEQAKQNIESYEWISAENAVSPYDFSLKKNDQPLGKVEVKSTNGDFKQIMHLSIAQLLEIRDSQESFDLYRIYELDETRAKLRIALNHKKIAEKILCHFEGLPDGVTVDGISLRPETMEFGEEIVIEIPESGELFAS